MVSKRIKRRTNRKKNRSIKRSIKRDLEKSLRKTIERSIKKSLNKFNKRIKKYKKKKTKKKIQRGGMQAAAPPPAGLGKVKGQASNVSHPATQGDQGAVINPIITNLLKQYDSISGNLGKTIEGCVDGEQKLKGVPKELAEAVKRVITKTYSDVLQKLKDETKIKNDKEAIREYIITGYPRNKGAIAKQSYLTEDGLKIFICDLYIKYELFKEDNLIIQREVDKALAAAATAAAAAAAAAANNAAAREAAKQKEREERGRAEAAEKIQNAFRNWAEQKQRAQEVSAATAIQAAYRGHVARHDDQQDAGQPAAGDAADGDGDGDGDGGPPQQPEPAPDEEPAAVPEAAAAAPQPSCLPDPESISQIRKRILECQKKLEKCEEEKAELKKQLSAENFGRLALRGQDKNKLNLVTGRYKEMVEELKEKLKICEEARARLETELEKLRRREQELLKARLCSLLAEIRINKLVTKKEGSEDYVENDSFVSDEVKLRLELPDEGSNGIFSVRFKYGNLIVMLVTACLLAGVIKESEAIDILKSEDLLADKRWIAGNNQIVVDYLNSLKIDGEFQLAVQNDVDHPYNKFIQAAQQAGREEAEAAAAAGAGGELAAGAGGELAAAAGQPAEGPAAEEPAAAALLAAEEPAA